MKKFLGLTFLGLLLAGAGCTASSDINVDNGGLDVDGGIDVRD